MSKKIPYNAPDGAVGYITDVTKEDFYNEPDIGLYDELEQSCYELVCDFAELIGVHLDKGEQDCRLANMVRDFVGETLEKEFGIPFPSYGEAEFERESRIETAKTALFKLEHQTEYKKLCYIAAEYGDVCIWVDAKNGLFEIDSGSSESLKAITERLGISSDDICDSSVYHKAYVKAGKEQKLDLDEQIALAGAKEYELTFFQGEENEKVVRVFLTEEQVLTICNNIAGKSSVGDYIQLLGGERIEICDIDAIEALDSDHLIPSRENNKAPERE